MRAGNVAAEGERGTTATGTVPWRDPRLLAAILLLVPVVIAAVWLARPLGVPADLLAVWTAGEFWQMGRTGEIYPPPGELFTMLPPAGWVEWLAVNEGYEGAVYPFLYPPLWAVVMGTLAPADFAPVATVALWVNASLLAATVILAIRATGALLHPVLHVVFVLVIFSTTHIASVGFLQGQPHILVAFLIVLAIERSRAGAGTAAGVALAVAASIKLFPAVYAVIWLARGERRALTAFVAVGGALAATSVLLAGWPLHQTFLDNVSQIGRTLLLTTKNVSFDAVLAELLPPDAVQTVRKPTLDGLDQVSGTWTVAARPALWAVFANAGALLVLVGSAYAARRMRARALYAGLWPFLLTLSVLFLPTGWIYYIIPAAVFAPALLVGLPSARGASVFLVGLLLFFAARLEVFKTSGLVPISEVYLYVAGALVWGLGFALVARNMGNE